MIKLIPIRCTCGISFMLTVEEVQRPIAVWDVGEHGDHAIPFDLQEQVFAGLKNLESELERTFETCTEVLDLERG